MKKEEIKVLIDAKQLAKHSLKLTQNLNNFPKKYRFTLVDKIVRSSLDICNYIIEANSWQGQMRIKYQTKAVNECEKLKIYLEITLEILRPQCSISNWNSMIDSVETQLKKWRKSTK